MELPNIVFAWLGTFPVALLLIPRLETLEAKEGGQGEDSGQSPTRNTAESQDRVKKGVPSCKDDCGTPS